MVGYLFSTSHLHTVSTSSVSSGHVSNLLASEVIGGTECTETKSDSTNSLDVKLALRMSLISTVANSRSCDAPQDIVADEDWVVLVLVELLGLLLDLRLSFLALG